MNFFHQGAPASSFLPLPFDPAALRAGAFFAVVFLAAFFAAGFFFAFFAIAFTNLPLCQLIE